MGFTSSYLIWFATLLTENPFEPTDLTSIILKVEHNQNWFMQLLILYRFHDTRDWVQCENV